MKRSFFLLLSLLSLFFSACDTFGERIEGNGNVQSVSRPSGRFSGVQVSSNINLHIKQDSIWSVRIVTDDNLMDLIETTVHDNVLHIEVQDNYNLEPSKSVDVYVTAPEFRRIGASGATEVTSENKIVSSGTFDIDVSGASNITIDLKAPRVEAGISGASKATLRGETRDISLNGSGASEFRCFELLAENADIDVSGSSNADVYASVSLKAEASGASDVRYKGSPTVNANTSGAGSVAKAN
jgi:hypothetical protein